MRPSTGKYESEDCARLDAAYRRVVDDRDRRIGELVEAVRTRDTRIAELTGALTAYRDARRTMVQAVQLGPMAPQQITSQILEAEALAGRVLAQGKS